MATDVLKNTLKVQRAQRDLTQADLAELAGTSRKSINAIEAGRMVPSTVLALRLANALAEPVETLFALADGPAGPAKAAPTKPDVSSFRARRL